MKISTKERFYAMTQRVGGCLEWTGHLSAGQRARFWMDGKLWIAARAAWVIEKGEIPEGMCVLHTCDNPKCVGVKHLFLGTLSDNARDMYEKGRGFKGDRNPWTRGLTHCLRGHEFSGENLGGQPGRRICKACARLRHHLRKAKEAE